MHTYNSFISYCNVLIYANYDYRDPAVQHALAVRQALQLENYHQFFLLYQETPTMGNYILDSMLDTYRVKALQCMCKAYKPSLSVSFVIEELEFDTEAEGMDFLTKAGCIMQEDSASESTSTLMWNTKDTTIDASAVFTQEKLLL